MIQMWNGPGHDCGEQTNQPRKPRSPPGEGQLEWAAAAAPSTVVLWPYSPATGSPLWPPPWCPKPPSVPHNVLLPQPMPQLAPRPAMGSFSNSSHALILVRLEACPGKAPCPIYPGRLHGAHQNPTHSIVCVQKALRPRWSIMGSKGRLFLLLFDFTTLAFFQFWKTKI